MKQSLKENKIYLEATSDKNTANLIINLYSDGTNENEGFSLNKVNKKILKTYSGSTTYKRF